MSSGLPALCLALLVGGDDRDTVHLAAGRELKCRVVLELDDRIAVQVGSRERWIPASQVVRVQSVARAHRELLARMRAVDVRSIPRLVETARHCASENLVHEEKLLWWMALLVDAEHDEANEALGHRKSKRGWLVRHERAWLPLADAEKARADFSDAWVLRSEHFRVRCDAGLATTIHTLFELEYLYDAFFQLFQRDLELREVLEPIDVHLYRDRADMPSLSSTVGAYFARDENILYTWLQQDGRAFALFHEGTHGVLWNVGGRSTRSRGSLPAWLDEAWAEYMRAIVVADAPGRAHLARDHVLHDHLATVRSAAKPYGVHRILNFKATDYSASTGQDLKYAQGYALFLHMMNGEDGRYRERFTEYLRAALAGKGQASTFRRMFQRDLARIEVGHLGK